MLGFSILMFIFLGVSGLVGAFALLANAVRVARVELRPDAVRYLKAVAAGAGAFGGPIGVLSALGPGRFEPLLVVVWSLAGAGCAASLLWAWHEFTDWPD